MDGKGTIALSLSDQLVSSLQTSIFGFEVSDADTETLEYCSDPIIPLIAFTPDHHCKISACGGTYQAQSSSFNFTIPHIETSDGLEYDQCKQYRLVQNYRYITIDKNFRISYIILLIMFLYTSVINISRVYIEKNQGKEQH